MSFILLLVPTSAIILDSWLYNSKNKTFTLAILNGNPPEPSLFIWALLNLHNDADKVPRKHTKTPLSFLAAPLRRPNNTCKPLWLLSASLRVMSLLLDLKANELTLGLAFNQASDQQQIAHHNFSNFYKLNYLELCSSNELCTRVEKPNLQRVQSSQYHIIPA